MMQSYPVRSHASPFMAKRTSSQSALAAAMLALSLLSACGGGGGSGGGTTSAPSSQTPTPTPTPSPAPGPAPEPVQPLPSLPDGRMEFATLGISSRVEAVEPGEASDMVRMGEPDFEGLYFFDGKAMAAPGHRRAYLIRDFDHPEGKYFNIYRLSASPTDIDGSSTASVSLRLRSTDPRFSFTSTNALSWSDRDTLVYYGSANEGLMAYGVAPEPAMIPKTGVWRYEGMIWGRIAPLQEVAYAYSFGGIGGTVDLDVDFATGRVGGRASPTWSGPMSGDDTIKADIVDGKVEGTGFTARLVVAGAPFDGRLEGRFTGNAAQEYMVRYKMPYHTPEIEQWGWQYGVWIGKRKDG